MVAVLKVCVRGFGVLHGWEFGFKVWVFDWEFGLVAGL